MRVEFFDPDGTQMSLPASCTSLSGEDPYRRFGDESALFRVPDLLEFCEMTRGLSDKLNARGEKAALKYERLNMPTNE